jgi:hypothetical protein
MEIDVIEAEYYNVVVDDDSGAATKMLAIIAKIGVSLLAYKSISMENKKTRFTLFAIKSKEMSSSIKKEGLAVEGPFPALFVHGDDVPGALAGIFERLAEEDIVVKESSGIANINNGYGVVLYFNKDDVERAYTALNK